MAEENKLEYLETSAKEGLGITELFEQAAKDVLNLKIRKSLI